MIPLCFGNATAKCADPHCKFDADCINAINDNSLEHQTADVVTAFKLCQSPEKRRAIFVTYLHDLTIARGAITNAMKQLGIRNDFTIEVKA